jgi:hypothetical protein
MLIGQWLWKKVLVQELVHFGLNLVGAALQQLGVVFLVGVVYFYFAKKSMLVQKKKIKF